MATLTLAQANPTIRDLTVTEEALSVAFSDGRVISLPLSWYPRLSHAKPEDRVQWRFTGRGRGIHWPNLDEDISAENILHGEASSESAKSFRKWREWYGGNR